MRPVFSFQRKTRWANPAGSGRTAQLTILESTHPALLNKNSTLEMKLTSKAGFVGWLEYIGDVATRAPRLRITKEETVLME